MENQIPSKSKNDNQPDLREVRRSTSTKSLAKKSIIHFDTTILETQTSAQILRINSFSSKSKVKSILKNNMSTTRLLHKVVGETQDSKVPAKKEKLAFNFPDKPKNCDDKKNLNVEKASCNCACIIC